MGKYLVVISASDNTGNTYTLNYEVSEILDNTLDALKEDFQRDCGEFVYMRRGTVQTIDLETLVSEFEPRDNKIVLTYTKQKEKELDMERLEYKRLKSKFESQGDNHV